MLNGVFSLLFCLSRKNVSGNGNSEFGGFPIYSRGVPDLQRLEKPHQTVLLSIKCSFLSVGWSSFERLVVPREHFTATFNVSIEVVSA